MFRVYARDAPGADASTYRRTSKRHLWYYLQDDKGRSPREFDVEVPILLSAHHPHAPDQLGVGPRHSARSELLDRHPMVEAPRRLPMRDSNEQQQGERH